MGWSRARVARLRGGCTWRLSATWKRQLLVSLCREVDSHGEEAVIMNGGTSWARTACGSMRGMRIGTPEVLSPGRRSRSLHTSLELWQPIPTLGRKGEDGMAIQSR